MRELMPGEDDQRFIRRLVLVVLVAAVVAFLYHTKNLLLLAFGAVLCAVLLSAVANLLARYTPLSRGMGLAVATLALIGTLVLMGWLFGTQTARELEDLRRTLPADLAELRRSMLADPLGGLLLQSVERGVESTRIADRVLAYGTGVVEVAVNLLIIIVGGVFFAAQPELYRRGLVLLSPHRYRAVAREAVDDVGNALRRWLLVQLVSMIVLGSLVGVGLWWSGVEAPVALGVLSGISEFIPYVGPVLAMVPAIIIALAGKGSLAGTLATYLIVRIVQTNLLTPLLTRRLVSVPPGLYLFLILASGFAFGTFGLFFAGALAVTFYTLGVRLYSRDTLGDPVKVPGE